MGRLSEVGVCLVVAHEFEDIELLYPLLRLSEEGATVTVGTRPKERHFHTRPFFLDICLLLGMETSLPEDAPTIFLSSARKSLLTFRTTQRGFRMGRPCAVSKVFSQRPWRERL